MRSLIIDGGVPTPSADAGSAALMDLARGLARAGHEVFFYPDGRTEAAASADLSVLRGFTVPGRPFAGTAGLRLWLAENAHSLDAVILSRPGPAARYLPLLEPNARLRRIYFGYDIHYRRMAMGKRVGARHTPQSVRVMQALEHHIWRNCDVLAYPSEEECADIRSSVPGAVAIAIPIYSMKIGVLAQSEPRPERRHGLFVGGPAHLPNRDAVAWFVDEILPRIRQSLPDFTLHVAGAWPEASCAELRRDGVIFLGGLRDEVLAEWIDRVRMSVVPLRFGAGVKRKVVASWAEGLPVVTTPVGLQGLTGSGVDLALIGRDAAELAGAVVRMAVDDGVWRRCAEAGQAFAKAHYSESAYDAGIRRLLSASAPV